LLNQKAQKFLRRNFNNLSEITLCKGTYLYHGARCKNKIVGMRGNAMFSPFLHIGFDYAFKKDNSNDELSRVLFCCKLKKDIRIIVINTLDWNKFHSLLNKFDNSVPNSDYWLQNFLIPCLKKKYGESISGAYLAKTNEYIFDSANELLTIHRKIL